MRRKATHYRSRKHITEEELEKLVNGRVRGKRESKRRILRHKAILFLLFYHALRKSELYSLKWDCIDFHSQTIHIKRSKGGKDSIHPLLKKELNVLTELYESRKGDYVIDSPGGKMLKGSTLNQFFRRINAHKIINLNVHPHMLRHGCGFYLANKGIDTRSIQVYMGHSSIRSTEIYTEIAPVRFKNFFENEEPIENRLLSKAIHRVKLSQDARIMMIGNARVR